MSTIKSFDDALDFHPASTSTSVLARFGHSIRTYWSALGDGIAAARTYNELTHRGVPHDTAVQHVLHSHFRD